MSPSAARDSAVSRSFPRVSGDEPVRQLLWQAAATFSPRERG